MDGCSFTRKPSYKQPNASRHSCSIVSGVEEAAQPDEVAEPSLASQNEDNTSDDEEECDCGFEGFNCGCSGSGL